MDQAFTETEIVQAIKNLNPSKAPGPDGFSGLYYRKFQAILTPHLCTFFNAIRQGTALPAQENKAFIHVLPKPGKDHGCCENYCPILLINTDLKIMTRILAVIFS